MCLLQITLLIIYPQPTHRMNYRDLIDIPIMIFLLGRDEDSINILERLNIALLFYQVGDGTQKMISLSKYYLLFPDLGDRMCLLNLYSDDLKKVTYSLYRIILKDLNEFCWVILTGLVCLSIQLVILHIKSSNINISNELHHQLRRLKYIKHKRKKNIKYLNLYLCDIHKRCEGVNLMKINQRRKLIFNLRVADYYKCLDSDLEFVGSGCKIFDVLRLLPRSLISFYKRIATNKVFLTNVSRKTFHLFVFLIYWQPTPLKEILANISLLLLVISSDCRVFRIIFKDFLSKNDKGNRIMSHVYLLSAFLIPYYLLSIDEYRLNLTSICIFDSLTSFIGTFLGKKTKSYTGTLVALFCTLIIVHLFYNMTDLVYFVLVSLVEHTTLVNDNISIPLFSIAYFKLKKYY